MLKMGKSLDIRFYQTWFRFLKLSDYSNWHEDVREHLAPIAKSVEFEEWWEWEKEHFRQIKPDAFEPIESVDEYLHCANDPVRPIVAIHLTQPKETLRKAFNEFLKQYPSKAGPPEKEDHAYDLRMEYVPQLDQYDTTLRVIECSRENPEWPYEKIEAELNLIPKQGDDIHSAWDTEDYEAAKDERTRIQKKFIADHIRVAEEVIASVELGIFPPRLGYKNSKTGLWIKVPFKKIVAIDNF